MLILAALFSASSPLSAVFSPAARADDTLSAEASVLALQEGGLAPGVGLRFQPDAAFLYGEGRALGAEAWTGRLTAGLDMLPALDRVDLNAGAWGGLRKGGVDAAGLSPQPSLQAGFELGLVGTVGPLRAGLRHAEGVLVTDMSRLSEDEARLGWTLLHRVELFGTYSRFAPEGEGVVHGAGAGCAIRF